MMVIQLRASAILVALICNSLALKADSSTPPNVYDQLGEKLTLPFPTDFIDVQEFDGAKNITREWMSWEHGEQKIIDAAYIRKIYVDINSRVRISFNTPVLASRDFFSDGRISLAAQINQRSIEVEGYSEVGTSRTTVGATGMSPQRFLLDMQQFQVELHILNTSSSNQAFDGYKNRRQYDYEDYDRDALMLIKAEFLNSTLKKFLSDPSTSSAFFNVLNASPTYIEKRSMDLDAAVKDFNHELDAAKKKDDDKINGDTTEQKKIANEITELIKEQRKQEAGAQKLYEKFEVLKSQRANPKDGQEENQVSPSVPPINRQQTNDLDDVNDVGIKLQNAYIKIHELESSIRENVKKKESTKNKEQFEVYKEAWPTVSKILTTLANELNTEFERYIEYEFCNRKELQDKILTRLKEQPVGFLVEKGGGEGNLCPTKNIQYLSKIELSALVSDFWNRAPIGADKSDKRKQRVYQKIFQNLTTANISMSNIGAKRGDIITVKLHVTQADKTEPVTFTILELHVDEFGMKREIVDSFLLIKKPNEDMQTGSNTSPSNFKGAPGVSLLWSYNPRPSEKPGTVLPNAISYGFNVSYLDFDITKDVEIGFGPILGLFNNQIQIGFGTNLNVDGNFEKRSYYFLGFSFAKIWEKLSK